ncbi:MAG: hypothetical protein MUE40_11075 [Anaerolineae bacterium]|jgi:Tol biopolymer transport system component|nr:hypothetical protein [Anaerolineae bacterium]
MNTLYRLVLLLLLAGCAPGAVAPSPVATLPPAGPRLVVAWAQGGDLLLWQTGEVAPRRAAVGGVIRPYLAPDGQSVAFTRGPDGAPDTLWHVPLAGGSEQQLVGDGRPLRYRPGDRQIGDVVWLDAEVLYFNTLSRAQPAFVPAHDLYRVQTRTREVALLLPPGEGGRPHLSPDGRQIALVAAGTYGVQDGRIRVVDLLAQQEPRNLLFFVGVATGSHYGFYPPVAWEPGSASLLTAIPDPNGLYSETASARSTPPTRLWRLPVDQPAGRDIIGTVNASFFGLPAWSPTAAQMLFLERLPGSNTFLAQQAAADGTAPQTLARGNAGLLAMPQWLPGGQVIVNEGQPGRLLLLAADAAPQLLSQEAVFMPHFVDATLYVYATMGLRGAEMRYARIGQGSQFIGSTGERLPLFDAVLLPEQG